MYRTLVALTLAASGAVAPVAAQTAARPPAPSDAAAAVPPLKYDSAFGGYRPFREEEKPGDWRALNDEVGRAGGHAGIFGGASGHSGGKAPPAHKH